MPVEEIQIMLEVVFVSATGAAAAGLTGSLHCALMCGPLACALPGRAAGGAWHLGRIAAYAVVGGALGLVGRGVSLALTQSIQPVLPWLMALGLIATAFEWGKRLPAIPGLTALARRLSALGATWPAGARAFALGAATPFLPCGLLYGMFLTAIASGSPLAGAAIMGAFSLGAVPALVAVQGGARGLTRWPRAASVARRVVPLTAAAVLIVRALTARDDPAQCG